ncbi:MAG: AarF/ABC1/UbiB kinase family protein [Solirubrobacteraceae bacterium]|nr:AarF/ABC1/UbiB kinase family protein [Solirubrobacteraceae bacterium]
MAKSRLGRAAKLGGLAAGHAAREARTRTRTLGKDDDAKQHAIGEAHLETARRLVRVLGTMRGAAMKLGQTLSVIDVGVVPESHRAQVQAELAKLQHMAPTVSFAQMRRVIEEDLGGPLAEFFAEFHEEPIGAASIGQVYRAVLPDGREVAVKVQYPGIADVVRADMKNMGMALKLASKLMPGFDSREIADEVSERISEELDYELEASNHKAMAREYRDHPFFVVPDVVSSLCRERVIVTEFVHGRKFTDVVHDDDAARDRWGEILFRFYVNAPLRSKLLNGDPHPGNAIFLDDGRVAFLDFGFFKRQTQSEIDVQLELLRAVYARDADTLYDITVREGIITGGREMVQPLLEKYDAVTWWFMRDEDVTLQPDTVTKVVLEQAEMEKEGFGRITLPADHLVTLRAFGLVLGILGQLRATNNWFRIGREVIFDEAPVTELGRIEAGDAVPDADGATA